MSKVVPGRVRIIDGKQYEQQPDGKWAPSVYQQQLDRDAEERAQRHKDKQQARQQAARAACSAPHDRTVVVRDDAPLAFATGLALGMIVF